MDAAGPDTVVSWKATGYPGNRVATTDSMSLRTAASVPHTTPIVTGSTGIGRRGRSRRPSAANRRRVSAISSAMAPSPTGVTSSATSWTWPRSLAHWSTPTTHTRSP